MVKIVVRDAKEIVRAYLRGLGFGKDYDPEILMAAHPELAEKDTNITARLDELVYAAAQKVLPAQISKEKAVALYKVLYTEAGGASLWKTEPLGGAFENPQYREAMRRRVFDAVPAYCYSDMPTQVLESYKTPLTRRISLWWNVRRRRKHD